MRLCFSDPEIFLQLIWQISKSKESATNFLSILSKLLQNHAECYRKTSEIMPWAEANFFLWYKHFKDGRTSVDEDERSGLPSTSTTPGNLAKVHEAIIADRRQTLHDVCGLVGLSYGTVQRVLSDNLNMRRIWARFVPRPLSDDQKAHRVSVCRELKQQARDDPNIISSIITSDERTVYGYDPETEQPSSQWKLPNSPRPKKGANMAAMSSPCWSFLWHPMHCPQGIPTPWSNRQ